MLIRSVPNPACHFKGAWASNRLELFVRQSKPIEVDCYLVRRELVNWTEGDLAADKRAEIDLHLKNCEHCTAVYDGARNVVRLLSDENAIDLPPGFSRRLYLRLMRVQ